MSLTSEDREALWESIERAFLDTTTHGRDAEEGVDRAVEQIVARHVAEARAAALNEAGLAMRARFEQATRTDPHVLIPTDDAPAVDIERNGWLSGLLTAAAMTDRMVANSPPP